MTTIAELPAGFADKVLSAQSTFRSVMDAMARPGSVQRVAADVGTPTGLMRGAAAIALTLFDHDTTIWLDEPLSASSHVARWLRFHTSAPIATERRYATYALIGDPLALPDLETFALGSEEYPDRSTTLVLQVAALGTGTRYRLSGPGLREPVLLKAAGLPANFAQVWQENHALYPRGVDIILCADTTLAALPRSVSIEEA